LRYEKRNMKAQVLYMLEEMVLNEKQTRDRKGKNSTFDTYT
jgi:pantothenate kinase